MLTTVIDSNIWISGILWNGLPKIILKKLENKQFRNYICKEIIEEIDNVIKRDKFRKRIDLLNLSYDEIISQIIELSDIIEIKNNLQVILDDIEDNKILETAIISKSNYIITGDDHLLNLSYYDGIKIVKCDYFYEKFIIN